MTVDLARIAAQLCRDLNPLGERIDACRSHLAILDEITPKRGEMRDELEAMRLHVQWMHDAYCTIDERLVHAYRIIEHAQRVPHPRTNGASTRMQATRSGLSPPAKPTSVEDVTA